MVFLDLPCLNGVKFYDRKQSENGILSSFLRSCNCQIPMSHIHILQWFTSVGHLWHSPFNKFVCKRNCVLNLRDFTNTEIVVNVSEQRLLIWYNICISLVYRKVCPLEVPLYQTSVKLIYTKHSQILKTKG